MQARSVFLSMIPLLLCGMFAAVAIPRSLAEEPAPAAVAAFNSYSSAVQDRLAREHRSPELFLGSVLSAPRNLRRLHEGELIVEQLAPPTGNALPGAMLHDWRATAFVPRATAAEFTKLLRDFTAYPGIYAPQVLSARVLARKGDSFDVMMRVRQHHVFTVTMETDYEVSFGELDAQHRYSTSHSTRIAEIGSDGRALSAAGEHGFLWRQNTYWSCDERDGGLYLQLESVSLTRSIPAGLGWAAGPFVESIPRDSLAFALRATSAALRAQHAWERP